MKTLTSGNIIGFSDALHSLDLHRSFSYITTINDKGQIVGQKKLPTDGEKVKADKVDSATGVISGTPIFNLLSFSLPRPLAGYARVGWNIMVSTPRAVGLCTRLVSRNYRPDC